MSKGRLEAFSDGVIAILITIMILELKVPHGADMEALPPLLPVFLTYVLTVFALHDQKTSDGQCRRGLLLAPKHA